MTNKELANRGKPSTYVYKDNGADILAVAHLDSVSAERHYWMNHEYIACPTLDNRLGAWIITEWLPSMGITTDILLTDGEESGQSTAKLFHAPEGKQYKWMFSFDRTGQDVACYQYEGKELSDALLPYGLVATHGSYSDIADLGGLGCRGMNFGCAMYDYHGASAYATIAELRRQLGAFLCFYEDNKDATFPYTKPKWTATRYNGAEVYYGESYGGDYYEGAWARQSAAISKAADKERCDELYMMLLKEGMDSEVFGGVGPGTWWHNHRGTEQKSGPTWTHTCKRCQYQFLYKDTIYSRYLSRSLCKYCYLEVMSVLGLIDHDYRELALSRFTEGEDLDEPITLAIRCLNDFANL